MESPIDPDQALVARCKRLDSDEFEAAFEALYHRYRDRVYSIAYRITGTAADAMDVVQESFSVLFRRITDFRGEALFSTWLFRIVVNCAIDSKRRGSSSIQRRTSSFSQLASTAEPEDEESRGPLDAAQSEELGEHVHSSIQRLSPKLRAIALLKRRRAFAEYLAAQPGSEGATPEGSGPGGAPGSGRTDTTGERRPLEPSDSLVEGEGRASPSKGERVAP